MGARAEEGELRVLVFFADHDQLNHHLHFENLFLRFLRHTARPWTYVELSRKDQEIPVFPKQQAAQRQATPPRLAVCSPLTPQQTRL